MCAEFARPQQAWFGPRQALIKHDDAVSTLPSELATHKPVKATLWLLC